MLLACMQNTGLECPWHARRPQPHPEEAERMQAEQGSCQAGNSAQAQEIHMYDVSRPAVSSEK